MVYITHTCNVELLGQACIWHSATYSIQIYTLCSRHGHTQESPLHAHKHSLTQAEAPNWTSWMIPHADLVNQAAEREQAMGATMRSLQQSLEEMGTANEALRALQQVKEKMVRPCTLKAGRICACAARIWRPPRNWHASG
jgi:hypothetical protein